jgi:predicted transglutaminase-like cysteine proteinase
MAWRAVRAWAVLGFGLLCVAAARPAGAATIEPFAAERVDANDIGIPAAWSEALAAAEADATCLRENAATCVGVDLGTELASWSAMPLAERLDQINRWANLRPYIDDGRNWHRQDYWATLAQFIARSGDCEDYALAKYTLLRATGVAAEDLSVVIVDDRQLRQPHAVLAVRVNGAWLVLDNQRSLVLPPTSLPHYLPLLAVTSAGLRLYRPALEPGSAVTITAAGE